MEIVVGEVRFLLHKITSQDLGAYQTGHKTRSKGITKREQKADGSQAVSATAEVEEEHEDVVHLEAAAEDVELQEVVVAEGQVGRGEQRP